MAGGKFAGVLCNVLAGVLLTTYSATSAVAAPPPAPIWSGVYAGIHGGYATGDISYAFDTPEGPFFNGPQAFDHSPGEWFGGAHLGVQHQFGNIVFGLEVAYSGIGLSDTIATTLSPGQERFRQVDIDSLFVVGPRLGYATDRWMAYVKAGYATADVDTRVYKAGSAGSTTSGREDGWMFGAGLEFICWRGFILGIDYSYVHLDMDDRAGRFPDDKPFTYTGFDNDIHTVSLRLSYLFGVPTASLHDPLK